MPEIDKGPSKVEQTKLASDGLRGSIASTIADAEAHCFKEEDKQLLKFHGVYQQDDRDSRHGGSGKSYSMMIRIRMPGGALTSRQWLELDDLAERYGGGALRLTTRQGIQYHGILKGELKATIRGINDALLSTLSACGDVQRNVMAPPAPFADAAHRCVQRLAQEIALALAPASGAYHEIWLDGERVDAGAEAEPFYGKQYLPRKFKTGLALDTDNSVDLYTYDCGLIGLTGTGLTGAGLRGERTTGAQSSEAGEVFGWNLIVGGGLGMTHNQADTIARLASVIGYVPLGREIDAVRTVAAIFRDHGNRSDRRHSRLKYLLEQWGVQRFTEEFRRRIDWTLGEPLPMRPPRELDHMGCVDQGDGRVFYGVFVENGRVVDRDGVRVRSALRRIAERLQPGVRVTPMQSVLFTDLERSDVPVLEEILATHGVKRVEELSQVRRWSMACPALPTCGLALADSERIMPGLLDLLEREFSRLGIDDLPVTVRMTGCPNGCARPYNADIGFVGRKPERYHIYVGGGLGGDQLADLFAAEVPIGRIVETLRPLLERYRDERLEEETLGEYYRRIAGRREGRHLLTGRETPSISLLQLEPAVRVEGSGGEE